MRCQNGVALSPGLGTQDCTCLQGVRTGLQDLTGSTNQIVHAYKVLGRGCRISRVWNNSSNMPTRYKDGAARSQGFGTPDMPRAYQDGAAGSHGKGTSDRTCLRRIRVGLHDLTGREQQFQHAYEVSGWGCRISRVRNIRSNMHTMYQVGLQAPTGWELQIYMPTRFQELTSGYMYHGFETPDRTCI